MKKYLTNFVTKNKTPQSQPMSGTVQVRNSAGGYVFALDQWDQLKRFLILGSEGGSYYASQRTLTVQNATNLLQCIEADGVRVVNEIVAISKDGRAPKNDPAIFALALCASAGNDETRKLALDVLPQVCRIGTHLFTFAETIKGMRGWGRGLRRAIGTWYTERDARKLAYQLVKYRQRGGWTHRDTLRLAHPTPANATQDAMFKWVTKRDEVEWTKATDIPTEDALAFIWGFEQAQQATDVKTVLKLIADYDLPREAIPTQMLKDPAIWEALLVKMPMNAMIRNLGNMSRNGFLVPHSDAEKTVMERLTNADLLAKARVHPISVLSALRVYRLGYSLRGQSPYGYRQARVKKREKWTPTQGVMDALDTAFELAFQHVRPSEKRTLLGLDVSGSMTMGQIAGVAGLTPRDGASAMAMVTARTESDYSMVAFCDEIVPLNISAKMRLDDVIEATHRLPFGRTDCAQPMLYAMKHKLNVDTFVIYTDNETWAGDIHPIEALREYRQKMGIPAKLVVVGMVSNGFTIADPNDGGMLDIVGFDSASPALMTDFARGEL